MCKMGRFRSCYVCTKYHIGISPFMHSLVSNDSDSRQWRPWSDCTDVQADLGLHCLHVPGDMFLQDMEKICLLGVACWVWVLESKKNVGKPHFCFDLSCVRLFIKKLHYHLPEVFKQTGLSRQYRNRPDVIECGSWYFLGSTLGWKFSE